MRRSLLHVLKVYRWDITIAFLILLETAFLLSFPKGIMPHGLTEIGFSACSLMIGAVLLIKYFGKEVRYVPAASLSGHVRTGIVTYALLLIGMGVFAVAVSDLFAVHPTKEGSDVIPTVELAVRRLLGGERVYKTIDEWGYSLPLTYLPMQWLPYIPAELMQIDFRWIAVSICYIAAIVVVARSTRVSPLHGLASTLLLIYTGHMLLKYDTGIIYMTVELMVAGYYMLLITGISGRNPWLRGAFIAICLLSRYSLVLWLPLWAFVEFMYGNRKHFFRSCLMVTIMVLGIYIIPFLSKDWGAFARGYHYYSQAALGEWSNLNERRVPYQLDNGVGFARLFYLKLHAYSVPDRIRSLQKVHVVVCLGSVFIMAILYALTRRRLHPRIFLLASFKIYITLFLAFIQVPYPYLMITAVAVSIALFAELPRWRAAGRAA